MLATTQALTYNRVSLWRRLVAKESY